MEQKQSFEIQIIGFWLIVMRRGAQAGLRCSECLQDRGNQVSIRVVPYHPATEVSKDGELRAVVFANPHGCP